MNAKSLHVLTLAAAALSVTFATLVPAPDAWAADPPAGFALVGHIEKFTLDDASNPTSSAVMRVRGIDVVLPQNLIITMPGGYLTAQQVFKGRDLRSPIDPQRSGLALLDFAAADANCPAAPEFAGRQCPQPAAEAELSGNVINGTFIAGIARVSQGGLHIGGGFIRSIDGATGTLLVGADTGSGPTARLKLNDPEGIYGAKALGQDMRFALDPGNSPVTARTGFPVCIQRSASDPLCPGSNRPNPAAAHFKRFTCGAVPVSANAPSLAGCVPHLPVPLREGDFVNYLGRLDKDATGYFFSLHGLQAEIGAYTSPGVDPAYVVIEEALEGTLGERYADIPQEETSRFKLIGFTTDPSRTVAVDIFDDDVDGGPLRPVPPPSRLETRIVPTNGAQLGRFKMIWDAKEDARIVRRATRVTLSPATQPGDPRFAPGKGSVELALPGSSRRAGYAFGSFEAPINEYISPEATRFGVKGYQPPINFENFCFQKRTNSIETQEPDPGNATGWVVVTAQPLSPTPAARALSQLGSGARVCGIN
jgi:hypothetical protein